jgi:two-component system chemotaxis response regulator CheY
MNLIEKALIVDDEYHIRKYMSLVLRSMGVTTVCEASNGAEGVDAYVREQPDLVLLDVNMPVMDGIEALLKIRSLDADASIVMLTSLANRHTIEQAVDGGALHYIRKDTPRDELIALLNGLLAERNQAVS